MNTVWEVLTVEVDLEVRSTVDVCTVARVSDVTGSSNRSPEGMGEGVERRLVNL